MQFDVKIRKVIENGKPLKALASVTVDGSFTIHNVRVIKTENAQFVAMPYAPSRTLTVRMSAVISFTLSSPKFVRAWKPLCLQLTNRSSLKRLNKPKHRKPTKQIKERMR